jgi:type II secretory pathway pseudopilin PulG
MKTASTTRTITIRPLSLQRGASLLEGIAYLGIAAIVILGAVSLLTTAFGTAQSNRANEEVISLRTAARKLYTGQTYPAAMVPTMIAAKAVPATLVIDTANNTITNTWNGAVTIAGSAGAGGVNNFTITYNSVPQDACVSMLSGATGWTQVTVGTTNITTFPVPANSASNACSAATNTVAMIAS